MRNYTSKIFIVGAGPGDPELITLKAHRLISKADVLLYDDLVGKPVIDMAPKSCIKYNVGKRYADGKDQGERLKNIISLIREHSEHGKCIVRLKGGDPMIFSRSAEEVEQLLANNIDIEMVPGISSGVAAGNLNLIPLTERLISEGLMMVTGSTSNERLEHLQSIVNWLMIGNTVLLYMGFKRFSSIRETMYSHGLSPDIPACAVSKVSLPDEEILLSTIEKLPEEAAEQNMKMPVVIIMGRHVRQLKNR